MSKSKIWGILWTPIGVFILVVVYPMLNGVNWVVDRVKGRPNTRRAELESSRCELEAFRMSKQITFKLRKTASPRIFLERIWQVPDVVV